MFFHVIRLLSAAFLVLLKGMSSRELWLWRGHLCMCPGNMLLLGCWDVRESGRLAGVFDEALRIGHLLLFLGGCYRG